MSKLQLFRDFVNERLAVAALEIFGQYEKTLAECQGEICPCKEKSAQLQRRTLDIKPEIELRRTDVQQRSLPEPRQIKEEPALWTSQGGEQLQEQRSDTTDSIFPSPRVDTCLDPEHSAQLPPLEQTPAGDNRERDSLPTNKTEKQIKVESNEEEWRAASNSQLPSVTPHCSTTQSLKDEDKERGSLPASGSSHGPNPWTIPISSSCSGSESDDVSAGEDENKTLEKPYQCGKAFSRRDSLAIHGSIHTGQRRYQCKDCDKAFSHRGSLARHRRIHTVGKPYHCQECGKAFGRQQTFLRHKCVHSGDNKLHQCQECGKAFSTHPMLVVHRECHTTVRRIQCKQCGKVFNSTGHLNTHRRIHTGEKPYKCEQCGKAFSQNSSLVRHRRIHTGEKPYQCPVCAKAFSDQSCFIRHRLRIHAGEEPYQPQ